MVENASAPRPFRLVALDLDGTLLDDRGRVSEEDAAALRRFRDSGGVVVLASGRMTANVRPVYELIGVDGPTIAYNGARAQEPPAEGGRTIFELPLPARYADELIVYTRRERFHLNYYLEERLYAVEDPELRRFADVYSRQTGARFEFVPDLGVFRNRQPTKLLIVTDPTEPGRADARHRDELYEVWHARWGAEVTVMRTNPEYLEFYHREAGKGRALEAVAKHYGIERSLTLAIGDNFNDVSLLQAAGCGVAVANANADAIAAAGWVSSRTNNQSAVAETLERLMVWADGS